MSQAEFSRADLERFLEAVDECLEEPAKLILLGGSAVILAYGVTTTTEDIDTFEKVAAPLERAFRGRASRPA